MSYTSPAEEAVREAQAKVFEAARELKRAEAELALAEIALEEEQNG